MYWIVSRVSQYLQHAHCPEKVKQTFTRAFHSGNLFLVKCCVIIGKKREGFFLCNRVS